jgi:predicted restriction endonuclease
VTQRIQDGSLTLSSVSALQTFFKNQKKLGLQTTAEEKRQVITQVEGLSRKETEKTLHQIQPEAISHDRGKIALNDRTLAKLQKLKAYWSHKLPESSPEELLERLLDDALALEDKKRFGTTRADQRPIRTVHSAAESNDPARPAIPAPMRRHVWRQAQGRCQYVSANGRRCDSQRYLEIDHIVPWGRTRRHELANLRLLCRAHNQPMIS